MPVFNECRDHRKVPFLTQTHQPKPINFEKLYNYQTVILRNEFCMVKKIQIWTVIISVYSYKIRILVD